MTTLLTPSIIAKESLIALENECVLANLVHRDYSTEFKNVGATVTIRKPTTFSSTAVSSGSTIAVQTVTESSVQVILNQNLDVSFEVTSAELSLDIVSFSEQLIQPAMRAHAQKIDELLAALYSDIAGHTGVSSTPAVGDIANLRAQLGLQKVPYGNRSVVLAPVTEAAYLSLDAFLNADKRGDTKALKEASMGRVLGMDFYMDQNIPSHTSGAHGDLAMFMLGAATAGATVASVDACSSGCTIAVGDVFKITGDNTGYRVTTACTATTTTLSDLAFSPALGSAAADNAVVTFQDTHVANLAFHKNTFALVTAPLAPPIGGAKAAVETYNGLSCRVVYDYNATYKKNTISIDMLAGVKTLDKELAARLCDAR